MEGPSGHHRVGVDIGGTFTDLVVFGDLYAQTSSNAVGARELIRFMDEFALDSIDPLADAIRKLPNGRYENKSWMEVA